MTALPPADWGPAIVATGPLTGGALAASIQAVTGQERLAFFDAIAPIVHRETIDMETAWFQSRYDKLGPGGTGADYINCPLDRDAVRGLRRGAARGGNGGFPRIGEGHALFRRLPADRGHGGARASRPCGTGR